ncbi:MAG: anion permease [Desulfarculus sp.]|nr:anion permease [Desulfarculus sp.]
MKSILAVLLLTIASLLFPSSPGWGYSQARPGADFDLLTISGQVRTPQGKGVREAQVRFFLEGQALEAETETSAKGTFRAELRLPRGSLPSARLEVQIEKPSFTTLRHAVERLLPAPEAPGQPAGFLAHQPLVLERAVTPALWIASLVLLGVYVLIALELMHRTLAALLGGSLLLAISYTAGTFDPGYFILSYHDAMAAIDLNVVFLLMAMMIIVGVMKRTGVFQWMAYKSFQMARGNVPVLAALLMVLTALASAFLDNVTTMLLIIPVTVEIALTLKINPLALLMPQVFASNVGGTATLIGDPPNIMIGSFAKLSFLDFVSNLGLVCLICLGLTVVYYLFWYRRDYQRAQVEDVPRMIAHLRQAFAITDARLLTYSLVILGTVIAMFIMHGTLHMEPSIAALIGASALVAISRVDIVEMLEREVEWPTLIFFMFLFVVVPGAEETGLIQMIADQARDLSRGSLPLAIVIVLWVSAIASAFIDNIPFTATMLPIVAYLNQVTPGAESGILWWSLALGACLGGNGTMIGASANVVTVGLAEKAGYPISFLQYMKAAFPPMLLTLLVCTAWLLWVAP